MSSPRKATRKQNQPTPDNQPLDLLDLLKLVRKEAQALKEFCIYHGKPDSTYEAYYQEPDPNYPKHLSYELDYHQAYLAHASREAMLALNTTTYLGLDNNQLRNMLANLDVEGEQTLPFAELNSAIRLIEVAKRSPQLSQNIAKEVQLPPDGWYTDSTLARHYKVNRDALRKRLDRFVNDSPRQEDEVFRPVKDRKPREPQREYKLSKVQHLIDALLKRSHP